MTCSTKIKRKGPLLLTGRRAMKKRTDIRRQHESKELWSLKCGNKQETKVIHKNEIIQKQIKAS